MLSREISKNIRKYAKLRGYNTPGLNFYTLRQAYIRSNGVLRKQFEKEMQVYFDAIKDKRIKKGQSILHVYDSAPKGNTADSK